MEKRTLTIEEMIKLGASWKEIEARVKAIQKEEEERKAAERAKARAEAKKREAAAVARERLVAAFADWGIAEGFITEEGKEDFMGFIDEAINDTLEDLRYAMMIKKIFGQR